MGIGVVSTERDVEHASVQSGQQQQPNLPSSTWVSTIPRSTTAGLAASLSAENTRIRHIHWAETEHSIPRCMLWSCSPVQDTIVLHSWVSA